MFHPIPSPDTYYVIIHRIWPTSPEPFVSATFVITQTSDGQYQFELRAANGRIVLTGEKYMGRSGVKRSIVSVKMNAPIDAHYERKTSQTTWNPYFVLKGTQGEIIGTSEEYSSNSAREKGIAFVQHVAPIATLIDISTT
jgi:uncharacterized protein YegP (UPF0339 family)